jgi:C2 domain of PTEN tumour-suppressor protein
MQREVCRLADFELEDADASQSSADDPGLSVQCDASAEAHRQRERLQSQVMEGLMQLQPSVEIQQTCITDDHTSLESPWQMDESRQAVYRVRQENWQRKSSVSGGVSTHRSIAYRTLTLEKSEIDKANKDKQHKLFPADFRVCFQLQCKIFFCFLL